MCLEMQQFPSLITTVNSLQISDISYAILELLTDFNVKLE